MRRNVMSFLAFVLVSCVLFAHARPAASDDGSESSCVSAYGSTACGYHCVWAYGDVQCSDTPQGACLAAYGQVRCWDPPEEYHREACGAEPASCLSAYGDIACGYGCVFAYGIVRCSERPGGKCAAAYGDVTCTN
jgi:hypothetical protein